MSLSALKLYFSIFLCSVFTNTYTQESSIPTDFFTGSYYLEHENFSIGLSGESIIPSQVVNVDTVVNEPNLRKVSVNGSGFVNWETKDLIIDLSDGEIKLHEDFNFEESCANNSIDIVLGTATENEIYNNLEDDILILNYSEDINSGCNGPFSSNMKFYKNGILTPGMEPFILTFEIEAGDEIGFNLSQSYQSNDIYTVDWGDDTFSPALTSTTTHTYENGGTYDVKVWGQFSSYLPASLAQNQKILEIKQWGDIEWNNQLGNYSFTLDISIPEDEAPNLENVTNLNSLFRGSLMNANINHWDVSNVITIGSIFKGAQNFNQPLDQWDVTNVTLIAQAFQDATSFNQNLNNWNISNIFSMTEVFRDAESFNQPLSNWDVSGVTNMNSVFRGASNFDQDLNDWDVSDVTDFRSMFREATNFNQDLNDWDTSNAIEMSNMFNEAENFNGAIGNWNLSNLERMFGIFIRAKSFNQNIENWDVSGVISFGSTFGHAESFNQPLNNWDISNANSLSAMFSNATSFNQNLDSWDVSNIIFISSVFNGATSFNQPLNSWEVSNINMSNVFNNASSFNQPLDQWDFSVVSNPTNLFTNSGLDVDNYELLLATLVEQGVSDTTFNNNGLIYCDSTNRDILINENNVNILNDTLGLFECTENAFITTWQVNEDDLSITIPTSSSFNYDFVVDWGDGHFSEELSHQDDTSHTYDEAGIYEVKIFLEYPYFANLVNESDQVENIQKLKSVERWGNIAWKSFRRSFKNATHLEINAMDAPNLQQVESLKEIFMNAPLVDFDMSNWNVSQIKSFESAFENATSFNQPIENWSTSNALNLSSMFKGASSFNQNLNGWDTSQVTTMESMFENAINFNGNINEFDLSNVITIKSMFQGAESFNSALNSWNVGNINNMEACFFQAESFNQTLNSWDVSQVNIMFRMFSQASNFNQNINSWNVNNVIDMNQMFRLASNFNQPLDEWSFSSNVNLGGFLNFSGYQTNHYDDLLLSLSQSNLSDKNLGVAGLLYCDIESRNILTNTKNWTISGDSLRTNCDTYSTEDFQQSFNLYPNPTRGKLILDFNNQFEIQKIEVVNMNGKSVFSSQQKIQEINLTEFSSGIYFVRILVNNHWVTKKIIKQ